MFDRNKKFSSASKVVRLVFAQRFITIFNCRYHTSNHLNMCHKHTSLSPINCQSVDNCCIIINTLINHQDPILFTCKGVKQINNQISLNMTFNFTIRISLRFPSAWEFQMGNFQKYWSQNVGQDFFVLDFFHGWKILKVDRRDLQNRENFAPAGRFTCMNMAKTSCISMRWRWRPHCTKQTHLVGFL